jgi:hypothetical protein
MMPPNAPLTTDGLREALQAMTDDVPYVLGLFANWLTGSALEMRQHTRPQDAELLEYLANHLRAATRGEAQP